MKQLVILACLCGALAYALPVPDSDQEALELVQIPLNNGKELDILSLSDDESRLSERNKRTIGVLRDLFPELTKQVEENVNKLVGQIIRAVGPTILRSAVSNNAVQSRASFDADFDDDDDDSSSGTRVQIELPTFSPDTEDNDDDDADADDNNTNAASADDDDDDKNNDIISSSSASNSDNLNGENSIDVAALNQQLQETIRVVRQAQEANENLAANSDDTSNAINDQQVAEAKAPAIDELTLDAEDDEGDEDRNKRFLSFGFGGNAGASTGGGSSSAGGAGSGNFLFDIVRRTADRAARTVGTVYRIVAGTETLDLNDTGSLMFPTKTKTSQYQSKTQYSGHVNNYDRTARTINDGLFSGSVTNQQTDATANAADGTAVDDGTGGVAAAAAGGYTEGIPGPVTRLFVLANRGLSNLIQDLILRIAATSERVVNFKARLITSLI